LLKTFYSKSNPQGAEPIPDSVLINDGKDATYPVKAGKTYLFRILNIGAFPSFFFNIADHEFDIVEIDGVYTKNTKAKTFYIGAGMRYTILVTAKTGVSSNFDIAALVDTSMFTDPAKFKSNPVVHATLQYDSKKANPTLRAASDLVPAILPPIDDLIIQPLDQQKLLGPVTKQIVLDFAMTNIQGMPR
jgi:iron transport multicopper oxidase